MISAIAQTTRRSALLFGAILLNCGTAFAADILDDGNEQARALLSAMPGIRTERASLPLPGDDKSTSATEQQDPARSLFAGSSRLTPPARSNAREPDATSAARVDTAAPAYLRAQDSARKMILGRGA